MEVLDVPATVPCLILCGQRDDFIDGRAPFRHLIQTPVYQALQPVGFIPAKAAPEAAAAYIIDPGFFR